MPSPDTKHTREERPVEVVTIPYVHPKVDLDKLEQGKFLSPGEIGMIKKSLENQKDGVYKQNDRMVIKDHGQMYVMYGTPYEESKMLGKGNFGTVHLMQNIDSGEWIAVKRQSPRNENHLKLIDKENSALKKIGHSKFYHVSSDKYHYLGMPVAPGTDFRTGFIESKRPVPPVRLLDLSISMAEGLRVLHDEAELVHGDIKEENMILRQETREIVHLDLGLADAMDESGQVFNTHLQGSPKYMAPEIKPNQFKSLYSTKTDVYAMGIAMAEMYGLLEMVEDKNYSTHGDPDYREKFGMTYAVVKEDSKQFLENRLMPDLKTRKEIRAHLAKMTSEEADKRPTAEESKQFFENIRYKQLSAPGLINKVVCLDIPTYQGATPSEKLKIEAALQKADEVWLVAPPYAKLSDGADYISLEKELSKKGIIVNREVICYKSSIEKNRAIRLYANDKEKKDDNIYLCGTVNERGEVSYPQRVSKRHVEKIIQSLEQDCSRLLNDEKRKNNRLITSRVSIIQSGIKTLKKKAKDKDLTYTELLQELNTLQSKLYSEKKWTRFVEKYTGASLSTSRKEIEKEKKTIKENMMKFKLR